MEYAQQIIVDFLSGNLDIAEFRRLYDEKPEIDAFLQKIIDDMKKDYSRKILYFPLMIADVENQYIEAVPYLLAPETDPGRQYCPPRYESVRQCLTYEFRLITHDVETADGASKFYNEVYSIYYQVDQSVPFCYKYDDAYSFAIEVIPEYLEGGESEKYIQKYIIPQFPETMKKTERKKQSRQKSRKCSKAKKDIPAGRSHPNGLWIKKENRVPILEKEKVWEIFVDSAFGMKQRVRKLS